LRPIIGKLLLCLSFGVSLHGESAGTLVDHAGSLARSWTGIASPAGALSVLHNPALIPAGFEYAYGFSGGLVPDVEINTAVTGLVLDFPGNWGIGLGWSLSSDGLWDEQCFSLGTGVSLFPGFSAGLQARLIRLSIDGYNAWTTLACDLGIRIVPMEGLSLGVAVYAFNQPEFEAGEHMSTRMRAGLEFPVAASWTIRAGIQADEWGQETALSASWIPVPGLEILTTCEPGTPALALGLSLSAGEFEFALANRLGLASHLLTHALSISISPSREETQPWKGRVNLNTASLQTLLSLPGMTRRMATRIIRERNERPFASVQDLVRVHGITRRVLLPWMARSSVMESGTNLHLLTNASGQTSWINGMEIRHLMARGIRADLARRIILLRTSLHGFFDPADLALLPGETTNWIPLVFGDPR